MTLREAISLGLSKRTVTTDESGCDEVFHYFMAEVNGCGVMITNDNQEEWVLTVPEMRIVIETYDSAKQLINLVKDNGKFY